jgi:hypothetical protein
MDLITYERLIKANFDTRNDQHTIQIQYQEFKVLASPKDLAAADRLLDAAPKGGFKLAWDLVVPWLEDAAAHIRAGHWITAEVHVFIFAVVLWHRLKEYNR